MTACWAVCIAPAIAEMTTEENRPLAFSLFFSTGISVGVLGGIIGGQMPGAFMRAGASAGAAKEASLLIGCCWLPPARYWFPASTLAPLRCRKRVSIHENQSCGGFYLSSQPFNLVPARSILYTPLFCHRRRSFR